MCSCVPSACVGLCARACGPVGVSVSVLCSDTSPASRGVETPLLIPTPSFARRQSLLRSGDEQEAGVPTPLRPYHSPSATCAPTPALAWLLQLQRGHLLAVDPPAPKPAPSSRFRAPAWPGLVERGGAAEGRAPDPGKGVVCPATPPPPQQPTQYPYPAGAPRWPEASFRYLT